MGLFLAPGLKVGRRKERGPPESVVGEQARRAGSVQKPCLPQCGPRACSGTGTAAAAHSRSAHAGVAGAAQQAL